MSSTYSTALTRADLHSPKQAPNTLLSHTPNLAPSRNSRRAIVDTCVDGIKCYVTGL
jgi:hypothetical protein